MKVIILGFVVSLVLIMGFRAEPPEPVSNFAEAMPTFPGGETTLYKFMRDSFQIPAKYKEDCMPGSLFIEFVVTKTGKIEDSSIHVIKTSDSSLIIPGLDLIKKMTEWSPGLVNNEPVAVKMVIPYRFEMDCITKKDSLPGKQQVDLPNLVNYNMDDGMASFPGGDQALLKYIRAKTAGQTVYTNGKTFVSFVIDSTGHLPFENIKISRGLNPVLDSVAINIVREMPAWKPAKVNKKLVSTNFTLPIFFKKED